MNTSIHLDIGSRVLYNYHTPSRQFGGVVVALRDDPDRPYQVRWDDPNVWFRNRYPYIGSIRPEGAS